MEYCLESTESYIYFFVNDGADILQRKMLQNFNKTIYTDWRDLFSIIIETNKSNQSDSHTAKCCGYSYAKNRSYM